jgi:hypothetical protein
MLRHTAQPQRVLPSGEVDLGSAGGIEGKGIDAVDREQIAILVGVVSAAGRRNDQRPDCRRATAIVTSRQRQPYSQKKDRVGPHLSPPSDQATPPLASEGRDGNAARAGKR